MDVYSEVQGGWHHRMSAAGYVYPLTHIRMRGRRFPVPAQPERYLEAYYGPGWRVPDHNAIGLSAEGNRLYPFLQPGHLKGQLCAVRWWVSRHTPLLGAWLCGRSLRPLRIRRRAAA